ncbi:hypothetical protein AB0J83_32865 [Actinoplanes sp. NPDC049596]|uniref:hypothetical protein n=1 Tax=unclassified Actinoplanes TaxID=2626549 RepID=UPI00342FF4FE
MSPGIAATRTRIGGREVAVAVVAAILGGLSGLALGSWLAWRDVDPMAPGAAAVLRLAPTVVPGPVDSRVEYYGRSTFWNPYSNNSLHGGTGVRVGRAELTGMVPPGAGIEQAAAVVEQRMREHGWRDVGTTVHRYDPAVVADVTGVRDGYLAAVQITSADEANPATLRLDLMWAEPPGHVRDTVLGGLAGALLGALLGFVTSQRMRRYGPGRQRAYVWLCVTTLLLLTPAGLGNIPTSTGSLLANTNRNGAGPSVYWGGFVIWGAEPLALLSPLPILAILALCFWPRPPAEARPVS